MIIWLYILYIYIHTYTRLSRPASATALPLFQHQAWAPFKPWTNPKPIDTLCAICAAMGLALARISTESWKPNSIPFSILGIMVSRHIWAAISADSRVAFWSIEPWGFCASLKITWQVSWIGLKSKSTTGAKEQHFTCLFGAMTKSLHISTARSTARWSLRLDTSRSIWPGLWQVPRLKLDTILATECQTSAPMVSFVFLNYHFHDSLCHATWGLLEIGGQLRVAPFRKQARNNCYRRNMENGDCDGITCLTS